MSQNPQINNPTENNQPPFNNGFDLYSNGLQVNQLDQHSSNIFYNEDAACNYANGFPATDKVLPVHHSTSFAIGGHVDSFQKYTTMSSNDNCNNASNEQAIIQNSSQPFMNTSSRIVTSPEIIKYEIPGYDVIFIPKP